MTELLAEEEISALVSEKKLLPADYRNKIRVRPKRGHKEREMDLRGEYGSDFRLILRQSIFNPLDFSVILAYRPPQSNIIFRLKI